MNELDSVPAVEGMQIRTECELSAECPYDTVTDNYTVEIGFQTVGETVEYASLAEFLSRFEGKRISQEDLCAEIYAVLVPLSIDDISVTVSGDQYGMDAEVSLE